MPYFSEQTFEFLRALGQNNNRDWFNDNKQRYIIDVKEPLWAFLRDLDPLVQSISPWYKVVEKGNGGSMFRIHRDTRFSKNKAPYKTNAAARIWHSTAGRGGAPLYYLHLAPDNVFVGGGIWRPDSRMLTQLRQFIANNPNAWKKITRDPAFKRTFQLGGESLKRMPRGFDEGHELAIDLKRKDFALFCELTEAQATGSRFLGLVCSRYEKAADFMDYLCAALDVEFH